MIVKYINIILIIIYCPENYINITKIYDITYIIILYNLFIINYYK
jgi:hypothetical protein